MLMMKVVCHLPKSSSDMVSQVGRSFELDFSSHSCKVCSGVRDLKVLEGLTELKIKWPSIAMR